MIHLKRFLLALLFTYTIPLMAENILKQAKVIVPDSIHSQLVNSYGSDINHKFAFCPVYNILQPKNKTWGNGIYRYRMQGSHFPTKLCIYYNEQLYIFENEGWLSPSEVIAEFGECIKIIKINNHDSVRFLKGLFIYLKEEENMDYGITVK